MKRWLGAVLAVVLSLTMFSSAALAAGTTLTVKTPETIPKAGEEFTVTVDISGNTGFNSIQFTLIYDKSDLTCTNAEAGEVLNDMLHVINPDAPEGAILAAASATTKKRNGTLATFTFEANRDLSEFNFKLINVEIEDPDGVITSLYTEDDTSETPSTPTTPTTPTTPSTPSSGGTTTPTTPSGSTAETTPTEQETPTQTYTSPFPDAVGHWGEEWIAKAAERGLFNGDDKGNFRPNDNISRGDFVLVLWRMAGSPEPESAASFADVPTNAYYAKAVAWAYEKGYVNGKGNGFAPKDSLTRQEAMKILFGVAGGVSGSEVMYYAFYETGFADSGEIASWAKPAMYWAYYKTIISGTGANKLSPTATATRAQLAKILVGYQDMQIKEGTT